jgi:hypothetical protein
MAAVILLPISGFSQTESVDAITKNVVKVISKTKDQKHDWKAFRNLFHPEARIAILNHGDDFPDAYEYVTLNDFVEMMDEQYDGVGFEEVEISKVINEYNGIAHAFQSFEGHVLESDESGRGINSYELVYYDNRWWITSLLWTLEDDSHPIPEKYK